MTMETEKKWDVEAVTGWVASLVLHRLMEANPADDGMSHEAWEDLGELELTVDGTVFRLAVFELGPEEIVKAGREDEQA